MPRLIVVPDNVQTPKLKDTLMDETVHGIHLDDDFCAEQILQRLAWAVSGHPVHRGEPTPTI